MAANTGTIPSNLSIAAGQSLRRNAGDSAFEAYTAGSGTVTGVTDATLTLTGATIGLNLSNANNFSSVQTVTKTIGVTSADGLLLTNTTAAAAGAQQWSPRLRFSGNGWKTNATAASQTVEYKIEVQTVQGSAAPTGVLIFSSAINGGAFVASNSSSCVSINGGTVNCGALASSDGNIITVSAPGDFRLSSGKFMVGTAAAATAQLEAQGTGEHLRFRYDASNRTSFQTGSTGVLTITPTGTAPSLTLTSDFKLSTVGSGLYVKEGSNATMGVATLSSGTVVVSTTKVTANSRIFLTSQTLGTITVPVGLAVSARSAGTSFTILSGNLTDTSTVAWMIVEPA